MTKKAIPPDVLDEALLGADEEEHRAAWRTLVSQSGSGETVRRASKVRARLDLLADLLPRHAWLAEAIRVWRAARRGAEAVLDLDVMATFPEYALARQLAPDEEPSDEKTTIEWGEIRELRLRVGERVAFVVQDRSRVAWWYEAGGLRAPLPTAAWRLQAGEAPVAIHVFADTDQGSPFDESLRLCSAHALIVLTERE